VEKRRKWKTIDWEELSEKAPPALAQSVVLQALEAPPGKPMDRGKPS
jgi:hypothetical protein